MVVHLRLLHSEPLLALAPNILKLAGLTVRTNDDRETEKISKVDQLGSAACNLRSTAQGHGPHLEVGTASCNARKVSFLSSGAELQPKPSRQGGEGQGRSSTVPNAQITQNNLSLDAGGRGSQPPLHPNHT